MSKWSDVAQVNPFSATKKDGMETADSVKTASLEEANMTDRFIIQAMDGRKIDVLVDNGNRTVYPIKKA